MSEDSQRLFYCHANDIFNYEYLIKHCQDTIWENPKIPTRVRHVFLANRCATYRRLFPIQVHQTWHIGNHWWAINFSTNSLKYLIPCFLKMINGRRVFTVLCRHMVVEFDRQQNKEKLTCFPSNHVFSGIQNNSYTAFKRLIVVSDYHVTNLKGVCFSLNYDY